MFLDKWNVWQARESLFVERICRGHVEIPNHRYFSFFPLLDPIFVCYLAHFQCYPNQMWLPRWFPMVTIWLYVFSVRSLHQLLQQSLCREEQKGRVKLTRFIHNFPLVRCALCYLNISPNISMLKRSSQSVKT